MTQRVAPVIGGPKGCNGPAKGSGLGGLLRSSERKGRDFGPEARDNGSSWRTAIRDLDLTNPKKVFKFP